MLQHLLKHLYLNFFYLKIELKSTVLHMGIFNVILSAVCHPINQLENTVILAVASASRLEMAMAFAYQ